MDKMKQAIKTFLADLDAAGIGTRCGYEEKKVKEVFKKHPLDGNILSAMVAKHLCSPNRTVHSSQIVPHINKFLSSLTETV